METVSATQARNNFSELLNRAAYGGERILIKKRGKPLAWLSGLKKEDNPAKGNEDKVSAVDQLAGGLKLGNISKKLKPSKINEIINERYEKMLS